MKKYAVVFLMAIALPGCSPDPTSIIEKAKAEIRQAEQEFAALALEKGVPDAFLTYAAEEAVLLRGNQLITGKAAMAGYFSNQTLKNAVLQWSPDFVEVSASGDLGYTYGKYTFSAVDTLGQEIRSDGIFHTVWKKQTDGTWKFVWD